MPSLRLESRVLLPAVAMCVFGILQLAHIIHLSDSNEMYEPFFLALILALICVRRGSHNWAVQAVFMLCNGIVIWMSFRLETSVFAICFERISLGFFALIMVISIRMALREHLQAKLKDAPVLPSDN